jgi:hypothetical protein
MRLTQTLAGAALLASAAAANADDHAGLKGYALAGDGTALIMMNDLAMPGEVTRVMLSSRLDAIAYRPVTGALLGFANDGTVYEINTATGAAMNLGASVESDAMIGGVATAFDFNNAIDAVRAVGSDGANLVYFPTNFGDERANSVRRFTDVFYVAGDANEGREPFIYANAYTNAVAGMKAGGTFQYALDARTDSLVSLGNNSGELRTVAPITVDGMMADLVSAGGFDIVSPEEGTDMAFAILQLDGEATSGLYRIDLETGAATLLADLGVTGFTGFAASM